MVDLSGNTQLTWVSMILGIEESPEESCQNEIKGEWEGKIACCWFSWRSLPQLIFLIQTWLFWSEMCGSLCGDGCYSLLGSSGVCLEHCFLVLGQISQPCGTHPSHTHTLTHTLRTSKFVLFNIGVLAFLVQIFDMGSRPSSWTPAGTLPWDPGSWLAEFFRSLACRQISCTPLHLTFWVNIIK